MYDIMKQIGWLLKTFILVARKWLAYQILDEINARSGVKMGFTNGHP
jgi:hypothetical protein